MDSRLAADPVARHILEILSTLEKAAGVRAHYRILDPPPLTSTDLSTLQTVARVLGDWIGLRNAMFDVTVIEHNEAPRLVRIDPDHEEFAMELPAAALATADTALAALTRQVARAYLITSNIGGSSVDPSRTAGSLADVTAIFLGMGKLILNAPAAGAMIHPRATASLPEDKPLSPEYLAFTHRLVSAMRGLDWNQHTSGMNTQALGYLRKWDPYRDTVFSQALRNVLTASASHRPLMDAVEDNHLALARFDQLQRVFQATVLLPLQQEVENYHRMCREGVERLNAREQDTYDPCLLYLNQLRRRMDLQRYADMLQVQQDHVVNRLRVLSAGLSDLQARDLVHPEKARDQMSSTHCPFDGTAINIQEMSHDTRVKCPTCGYAFLATPGIPQISALRPAAPVGDEGAGLAEEDATEKRTELFSGTRAESAAPVKSETKPSPKSNKAATILAWGIALLPLSWLPMLGYLVTMIMQGKDSPLTPQLGQLGIAGSLLGLFLVLLGLIGITRKWAAKRGSTAGSPPAAPALQEK